MLTKNKKKCYMAKFYFTRYHISTGREYHDKVDFVLNGLRNDASYLHRGFLYKFFNSEVLDHDGREFLTGELVKYIPEDNEEVVDDETMTIKNENVHNKVLTKVRYIIDPSSSILMHFETRNILSKESFRNIFIKLFEKNYDNFFTELSISPIKEEYSFVEKIKSFKSIKKITINLYPSNPRWNERWKKVDERLRANGIDQYRETQVNNKPESNILVDDETESKFLMSEDGYGKSSATGITSEGEEKTISTKDSLKTVYHNVQLDSVIHPIDILKYVYEKLKQVIERTGE